eukprot:1126223-Rhodomonas_salina.2
MIRGQAYTESELPRMLAYPAWCANKIVDAARQIMWLSSVAEARQTLQEGLNSPRSFDPSKLPGLAPGLNHGLCHHRGVPGSKTWDFAPADAGCSTLTLCDRVCRASNADPVGMGAAVDVELLAGGEVFLYAGQYAGVCEPTGYGSEALTFECLLMTRVFR